MSGRAVSSVHRRRYDRLRGELLSLADQFRSQRGALYCDQLYSYGLAVTEATWRAFAARHDSLNREEWQEWEPVDDWCLHRYFGDSEDLDVFTKLAQRANSSLEAIRGAIDSSLQGAHLHSLNLPAPLTRH